MSEKKAVFQIEGMTCAACQSAVERAVLKLEGVKKANVSLMTNSLDLSYESDKVNINDIIAAVDKAGYKAISNERKQTKGSTEEAYESEERPSDIFKKEADRLLVNLKISLPFLIALMWIAMGPMVGLPIPFFMMGSQGALSNAISQFILLIPIIFTNRSYFIRAYKSLKNLSPNMDLLIALGASASLVYGIFVIYRLSYAMGFNKPEIIQIYMHELYFESAGSILTLISLGKYLEARSKAKTGSSLEKLMDLQAKSAFVYENGNFVEKPIEEIKVSDLVLVKPGDRIPLDGIIVKGESSIDQSAMTGESLPVYKKPGDKVFAATINKSGSFQFEVKAVGQDTNLSQIIRMVKEANAGKAPSQDLADKISAVFVPAVILISIISFISWLLLDGSFEFALRMAISVLVISCPCALGLATPVVIMAATGKGADEGILVKSVAALDDLRKVKKIYFDKTGTLSRGSAEITDIICSFEEDKDRVLQFAASLEKFSEQPLAEAIVKEAEKRNISLIEADNFQNLPGMGIKGNVRKDDISYSLIIGNEKIMNKSKIDISAFKDQADQLSSQAKSIIYYAVDGKLQALMGAADTLKESSFALIKELKKDGIYTIMLSGDSKKTALAVADRLSIDECRYELMPADKEKIISLDKENLIAMVGDGINDSPALAAADIGIAVGSGTDVAIESADIVLMHSDMMDLIKAIDLSKLSGRKIRENLFWAFFYNAVCIPLAAGVFYPSLGLSLNPMWASAAMSLSSVFVVFNALTIFSFKGRYTKESGSISNDKGQEKYIEKEKIEENKMKKIVHIEGMSCMHCKKHVEDALNAIEGLDAHVDLEKAIAEIEMKNKLSDNKIKEVVDQAGYKVTSIEDL